MLRLVEWVIALTLLALAAAAWSKLRFPGARQPFARGLAVSRLLLASLVAAAGGALGYEASAALSPPLGWLSGAACAIGATLWVSNALVGLWLMSPLSSERLGDEVVVGGRAGRISGYGIARLELLTAEGWTARVPYFALVLRPVLARRAARPGFVEVTLRRAAWSDAALEAVRVAAVLTPFRQVTAPVTVRRRGRSLRVRLRLSRPGAETELQRLLEAAAEDVSPERR